jgi:hypothetical protein
MLHLCHMRALSRKDRMVENEVIFRDVNKNIQEFIEEEGSSVGKKIPFYCECSRPTCLKRIDLTPAEYKKLHRSKSHFVIVSGHGFSEVEKIVDKKQGYQVVEKHFQPPKAKDIDLALKSINTSSSAA